MHQYPFFTPDAGRYMVSETETRALLDYVLKHRNIAAILTFGESDNLVTAGGRRPPHQPARTSSTSPSAPTRRPGASAVMPILAGAWDAAEGAAGAAYSCRAPRAAAAPSRRPPGAAAAACQPATTVNAADLEYFAAIGTRSRELTGLRGTGVVRAPAGAFYGTGYFQFGVPSFSTPGWGLPGGGRPAGPGGAAEPSGEAPARPAGVPAGMAGMTGAFGQRGAGRGGGAGSGMGADGDGGEGIDQRLPAVDGQREGGRVRRLGALQSTRRSATSRSRGLQAVHHGGSTGREDARSSARRTRNSPSTWRRCSPESPSRRPR